MTFFYSDNAVRGSQVPLDYHRMNAVKGYLRHYDNYLYLDFIITNTDKMVERHQASKELTICERKLKWWANHPNFDKDEVLAEIGRKKREWRNPNVKTPGV